MSGLETAPRVQRSIAAVYFTCVVCGAVEEIPVASAEGLPPKVYWECLTCQMRGYGDGRTGLA